MLRWSTCITNTHCNRITDTQCDGVTDAVTHVHRNMSDGNTNRVTYAICLTNADCVTDKDAYTNRVTNTITFGDAYHIADAHYIADADGVADCHCDSIADTNRIANLYRDVSHAHSAVFYSALFYILDFVR